MIDPSIVTHESEIYRNLVSQHVSEDRTDFAILATADRLKDYSARHMTGVVGDGLAYLQMIRDGYEWFDHFENLPLTGSSGTARSPDFVFSRRDDLSVAISESKATRGSSKERFGQTVSKAYTEQVSPYLGLKLGSSVASHGFAIGSYLTSNLRGELFIHHTETVDNPGRLDGGGDPSAVRRGNYINILSLLMGPEASRSMRSGSLSVRDRTVLTTRWLGREWLLGYTGRYGDYHWDDIDEFFWLRRRRLPWRAAGFSRFALDLEVATIAFRALERPEQEKELLNNIPEMPSRLAEEAKQNGGAIFPDGFAVLADDPLPERIVIRSIDLDSAEVEAADEVEAQPEELRVQQYVGPDVEEEHQLVRLQLKE
ncbi:hypothetical protein ACFFP0_27040 [Rhizobium puerariae]|uniref:Restriction endonuclease n=1 Tax=Rhizobium puerariae TaxID=1585791 RepID=A0ABV6APH0_9HYPH